MSFKKVFRGYDPEEVDKFIADTAAREKQIRTAQKERIDELSDENYSLRQQVKQYQTDEQAISKSLISSQHLAQELKQDAERYSELVLSRAKIFYATWRAYSKTLVATLSTEEVQEFNKLQKKIEQIINAYEGKDVAKEVEERKAHYNATAKRESVSILSQEHAHRFVDVTPSNTTMGVFSNPISKVEDAAEQVIDLHELTSTEQSLEEICTELGLIGKK